MRLAMAMAMAMTSRLAAGCGDNVNPQRLVAPSANPRQNVMVIDEGFDLSAQDFHGRVAAAYTERCREPMADAGATGDPDAGAPSFGDLKRQLLDELATRDDSCRLEKGISEKADPLAAVQRFRARWNDALRKQRPITDVFTADERAQLLAPLQAELETFRFHGTATAGTIAHDNPDVRLVLVERPLDSQAGFAASFTCLDQGEVDQLANLISDPDVYTAYVNRPVSTLDSDLRDAATAFGVGVVNESFGTPPRAVIEALQVANGCPPVDLTLYFELAGYLDFDRARAVAGPPHLTVVSAGNDGTAINGSADSQVCLPFRRESLVVGSTDLAQRHSTFSNFGACVDVYAPGEWITVSYAGGWLLPAFGTSFSAPLVTRLVSRSAPDPFVPELARESVLSRIFPDRSLPLGLFPNDFFFLGVTTFNPTFALTLSTSGPPPAARRGPHGLGGGGAARLDARRSRGLLGLLRGPTRR